MNLNAVPIDSQIVALVKLAKGNKQSALESQQEFLSKSITTFPFKLLHEYITNKTFVSLAVFLSVENLVMQFLVLVGGLSSPALLLGLIHWIGFTTAGIARHSLASYWMQSYHGKIPKNSLFGSLQAMGRKGLYQSWFYAAIFIGVACFPLLGLLFESTILGLFKHEKPTTQDGTNDEESLLLPPQLPVD